MKKGYFAGIVTSLLLTTSILGACSSNEGADGKSDNVSNLNKTGMPIVKEKIEVDGFAAKRFSSQDWSKLMLWEEYEKMTNVEVNWETVSTEVLSEKRNLKLAAGDYPEFYFASAFPKTDLIKYGRQGVFLPLNDYIDKYAPNFKKILDEYPSMRKGITMADGNIYGFPAIYDPNFEALHIGTPWIMQEWLDKVGLKEPETPDELYKVLKAFKEKDPNGNGKADEQGWGGGDGIAPFIDYLRGTYGLNKQGTMNKNLDFKEGTKEFRFVPATDEYKELLTFLNKLYTEGLINKDVFTTESLQFSTESSKGIYGMLSEIDPATLLQLDGYVGVPVLEGPKGERAYNAMTNGLGNLGMFVLTDKAKNPEAMVRWMDYFYGEEGNKMFFMGFEGVTYEENGDGTVKYLDSITNNPDGKNLDQAVSEYLTWPGGYYPGIVRKQYFQGAEGKEASAVNAEKARPYRIKDEDILPGLNYTLEENDKISTITTDVQTYVDEMTAGFITGKQDFGKWDEYKKSLDKMGLQTYLEVSQEAYDRMQKEK
ncbi:extracellular solute-binding protein [Viridibacillus sp. FSL R5-0477]|uniref:Lipoprotein lplA n=1 Tax=Viridibacillus arenosi FSL R5-213 TaxID=1227360 RepID=W4F182_9BACL|nr:MULTISPECIES: extracellular solute-binding protein [Viridibacillus]ETT86224.1 lipoprotein lplA [Viridibacillus arenosi FSL R5-213]OMC85784.1 ABC transporter substrate-binding protein [Viridibacillus sp. FSL H7-0596]OMC91921.1 ABC transporter substrate-binding protein [Viridibacillus arenosi]